MQSDIREFTIRDLLTSKEEYQIPIYQRNYAWGEKEIVQLVQDVVDSKKDSLTSKYYIGTLVVSKDDSNNRFDTIDGQQRFTTLTLLACAIKNEHQGEYDLSWFDNFYLSFSSRVKATNTIRDIFNNQINSDSENYNLDVLNGYTECKKAIKNCLKISKLNLKEFCDYLFNHVIIIRVPLPIDTDLNHYFEIMNSRGEQLEKHEILKAELMSVFNKLENESILKTAFHTIWEACANMERYIQYGFDVDLRNCIFDEQGEWNNLKIYSFDEFVDNQKINLKNNSIDDYLSIDQLIVSEPTKKPKENDDNTPDRFNTVINFQNFLLHVLKVQTKNRHIALDDKRLISIFKNEMSTVDKLDFVKEFIFNLLKCKFLFDKYIIKREFIGTTDRWSLKRIRMRKEKNKYQVSYVNSFGDEFDSDELGENRQILILLSMFHVSTPTMVYKHWLNAVLYYLFNELKISSKNYILYLEDIAKKFVYDRLIAKDPEQYEDLIYNDSIVVNRNLNDLDFNKLRFGNTENNLIFNYIDYLFWLDHSSVLNKKFEFTFRSSVEHYYPQHPYTGKKLDDLYLHSIGNLCLISHSENSSVSNRLPYEKAKHFQEKDHIVSIKLHIMCANYPSDKWNEKQIIGHEKEVLDILTTNMQSQFVSTNSLSNGERLLESSKHRHPKLLACVLLGLGDLTISSGTSNNGERYNIYNWEQHDIKENIGKFINYVNQNNCQSLNEVRDQLLLRNDLEYSYRYLLLKFPEVLDECEYGNFIWYDKHEDFYIDVLRKEKRIETENSINFYELFSTVLYYHFVGNFDNLNISQDNFTLFFPIFYNGEYQLFSQNMNDLIGNLEVYNDNGECLNYKFVSFKKSNNKAILELTNFNWVEQNRKKEYKRSSNKNLIVFGENMKENFESSILAIHKLLKIGFNIKL